MILCDFRRENLKSILQFLIFFNSILFAICTSTFSKLCKNVNTYIQLHVEECLVALHCN
jgi:hypothetical protein